jgi:hypothetical protein
LEERVQNNKWISVSAASSNCHWCEWIEMDLFSKLGRYLHLNSIVIEMIDPMFETIQSTLGTTMVLTP